MTHSLPLDWVRGTKTYRSENKCDYLLHELFPGDAVRVSSDQSKRVVWNSGPMRENVL